MKALTTLIATAATLALLVPVAANATFDRSLPAKAPHAKIAKKGHRGHTRGGGTRITKVQRPKPPIIITGQPLPGTQIISSDDCANTGNNCTDEQACALWGVNCDQLDLPPTPAVSADSTPAAADTTPAPTDSTPPENQSPTA